MTRDSSLDEVIKRDWGRINEQYVRRGEIAADLSWLGSWNDELEAMNANKNGRPYRFPRSLVKFVRLLRDVWHLGLRQAEGLLRALSDALEFEVPDYTTLWHRLVKDEADEVVPPRRQATLAIDSTGLAVTQRGEWLRDKWHICRGFVKAHVAVDVATATVAAVMVSDDHGYDAHFLVPLVRQAQRRLEVVRVLADAAYDTRENFEFLRSEGIEAGINMRKNANQKLRGDTYARPLAVRERRQSRQGKLDTTIRVQYALEGRGHVLSGEARTGQGTALAAQRLNAVLGAAQVHRLQPVGHGVRLFNTVKPIERFKAPLPFNSIQQY